MGFSKRETIRDILVRRPRAVAVLEEVSGGEFWSCLDLTLVDLCAGRSAEAAVLWRRIEDAPGVPEAARDAGRLYALVDGLVEDHRRYREDHLPDLARMLAEAGPGELPPGFPLETLRKAFHAFRLGFLLHMIEEEEFLFPEALRAEGGVAHPESVPARSALPARTRPAALHTPEAQAVAMLDGLRRFFAGEAEAGPVYQSLRRRLDALGRDVSRHAARETGVLLPRARDLERILLGRAR